MMNKIAVLTLLGGALLLAAQPPGFVHWRADEMKKAVPKVNLGNHSVTVGQRDTSGTAEIHEGQNDIFIVQGGEAQLIVGGELVSKKTASTGELRGDAIRNGEIVKLAPGDMVHIPAGTAHQLLIEKGKPFTYLVIKIDAPK